MSLDVEALLQPVSEEEPAGPDLSYDPDFRRISRELDAAVEKDRPGDDPAVGPAAETAVALLARSKDLWIASHGFCFSVYSGDLPRCVGLLEVMAGLLEQFWDTCHPLLDEGSDPAAGRREACNQVSSIGRTVKHLERLYLAPLRSKGRISFKDIAGAADPTIKGAQLLAQAAEPVRRAIDETGVDDWQALSEQLGGLAAASARIAAVFGDKGGGLTPDLAALDGAVKRMKDFSDAVVNRKVPSAAPEAEAADESGDGGGGATAGGGGRTFSGPISTRAQALAQLDAVRNFFKATEPSSPLPILIDRVKRLAAMDFVQILQNLAPSGLEEALKVLDHSQVEPGAEETPSSDYGSES